VNKDDIVIKPLSSKVELDSESKETNSTDKFLEMLKNAGISDNDEAIETKIDWSVLSIEEKLKHRNKDAITLGLDDIISKPEA